MFSKITHTARDRLQLTALLLLVIVALPAIVWELLVFREFNYTWAAAVAGLVYACVELSTRVFARKTFLGPAASLLVIVLLLVTIIPSACCDWLLHARRSADTRLIPDLRVIDSAIDEYEIKTSPKRGD